MAKTVKNFKAIDAKIIKASKSSIRNQRLIVSAIEQEKIIKKIIKKHGPIINIEKDPQLLIDILVKFRPQFYGPDGGLPPGGVPNPPGPSSYGDIHNIHIMQEIVKLNKKLSSIKKMLR